MKKSVFFLLLLVIGGLGIISYRVTSAFYNDTEISTGNLFAAASTFGTPTPTPSPSPSPSPGVNPGDVVINEIMWMGSQGNTADQWIELRNTTGSSINISNWVVDNLGSGVNNNIVIPGGSTIPGNGFFVISNDTEATSAINVTPDYQTSDVQLQTNGEQLILRSSAGGTVIDTANDSGDWHAGDPGTGQDPKRSMERNNTPGDGTLAGSWHTATSATNMDAGAAEIATPKTANSPP